MITTEQFRSALRNKMQIAELSWSIFMICNFILTSEWGQRLSRPHRWFSQTATLKLHVIRTALTAGNVAPTCGPYAPLLLCGQTQSLPPKTIRKKYCQRQEVYKTWQTNGFSRLHHFSPHTILSIHYYLQIITMIAPHCDPLTATFQYKPFTSEPKE